MSDREWMFLAACKDKLPVNWFPEPLQSGRYARLICSTCTVNDDCLEYALRHQIRHGIWGGLGERERRRVRRFRKREAA